MGTSGLARPSRAASRLALGPLLSSSPRPPSAPAPVAAAYAWAPPEPAPLLLPQLPEAAAVRGRGDAINDAVELSDVHPPPLPPPRPTPAPAPAAPAPAPAPISSPMRPSGLLEVLEEGDDEEESPSRRRTRFLSTESSFGAGSGRRTPPHEWMGHPTGGRSPVLSLANAPSSGGRGGERSPSPAGRAGGPTTPVAPLPDPAPLPSAAAVAARARSRSPGRLKTLAAQGDVSQAAFSFVDSLRDCELESLRARAAEAAAARRGVPSPPPPPLLPYAGLQGTLSEAPLKSAVSGDPKPKAQPSSPLVTAAAPPPSPVPATTAAAPTRGRSATPVGAAKAAGASPPSSAGRSAPPVPRSSPNRSLSGAPTSSPSGLEVPPPPARPRLWDPPEATQPYPATRPLSPPLEVVLAGAALCVLPAAYTS